MEREAMKKKKAGRPRQEVKKEVRACVSYSKAEFFVVREQASRFGITVTEYIRQVSLNARVKSRLSVEEQKIARQLVGMAANLNQLVKVCHQQGLLQAMVYFESYRDQLDDLLRKLKP